MKKTIVFLITLLLTFPSFPQGLSYPPDALNQNGEELNQNGEELMQSPELKPKPEQGVKEDKKETKKTAYKVSQSKVSVDFRETDIKEVARVFSKISGVSILVSEGVKASVTANIEGLYWKEALDLILKTYNLAHIEEKGFLIIVTYQKLQEQEVQVPLTTQIITLNFVDVKEAKKYVESAMTKRGKLAAAPRTNSLVINDTPTAIKKAENILRKLDKKTPQVLIDVLMVDRTLTDNWDFGIDWDASNTKNSSMTKNVSYTSGLAADVLTLHYGIASLKGWGLKDIALKMKKENIKNNILANPRILTLNNIPAEINIISQEPYQDKTKTDQGIVETTEFTDVGIKLNVTPHITPDNHVIMDIDTEQSFVVGHVGPDLQPQTSTRSSKNTMIVKDGQTVVIGGLRKREKKTTIHKVPILGNLPLLKYIFSSSKTSDEVRELTIFVQPHIVKDTKLVKAAEKNLIRSQEFLSHKFIDIKPVPYKPEAKNEETLPQQEEILNQKTKAEVSPLKEDEAVKLNPSISKSVIPEGIPDFKTINILPLRGPNE